MPRTLREPVPRVNIRIPKPMMDAAERIVAGHPELYNNRQQFVESAIREKIEELKRIGIAVSEEVGDDLSVRSKELFLAHAIINTVKEESLPAHHSDPKRLEQSVRRYLMKRAEREGKEITEERLDELTKDLLEYHKDITEGLALMGRQEP